MFSFSRCISSQQVSKTLEVYRVSSVRKTIPVISQSKFTGLPRCILSLKYQTCSRTELLISCGHRIFDTVFVIITRSRTFSNPFYLRFASSNFECILNNACKIFTSTCSRKVRVNCIEVAFVESGSMRRLCGSLLCKRKEQGVVVVYSPISKIKLSKTCICYIFKRSYF